METKLCNKKFSYKQIDFASEFNYKYRSKHIVSFFGIFEIIYSLNIIGSINVCICIYNINIMINKRGEILLKIIQK